MSTDLPTHLGGLQHLAPDVVTLRDDIYVANGRIMRFVTEAAGRTVGELEAATDWRVYRRIPVAKQGDIDGSGWKAVKAAAAAGAFSPAMSQPQVPVSRFHAQPGDEKGVYPPVVSNGTEHDQKPGVIAARALGCNALPTDAKARKQIPIYSGFIKYFPLAIAEVARVSQAGNEQHNPGKPLHWDRSKSGDELDALGRHFLDAEKFDTDGQRHSAKIAWRAMANLQKELEAEAGK
jgi:hypothetical protein